MTPTPPLTFNKQLPLYPHIFQHTCTLYTYHVHDVYVVQYSYLENIMEESLLQRPPLTFYLCTHISSNIHVHFIHTMYMYLYMLCNTLTLKILWKNPSYKDPHPTINIQ